MILDDFIAKPPVHKATDVMLYAGIHDTHFDDECFIVTDGVPSLPHAVEAAQLTAETAKWAYKAIRQSPFYWKEKLQFLKRIFRSTNLTLWQKRREPGFDPGLASALMVLITVHDHYWIGSAGNCNSYLYRDGLIDVLTKPDVEDGMITKAVGFGRKQLIPTMRSEKFLENDCIFLATDSIANFVTEDQMREVFEGLEETSESLQNGINTLVAIAQKTGSRGPMSACMVKRIVV